MARARFLRGRPAGQYRNDHLALSVPQAMAAAFVIRLGPCGAKSAFLIWLEIPCHQRRLDGDVTDRQSGDRALSRAYPGHALQHRVWIVFYRHTRSNARLPFSLARLATEALARHDYDWIKKSFRRNVRGSFLLTLAIVGPLVIFGRYIIHFWAGSAAVPPVSVLLWIGAWNLLLSTLYMASCLLTATYRLHGMTIYGSTAAVAILALTIKSVGKNLWDQRCNRWNSDRRPPRKLRCQLFVRSGIVLGRILAPPAKLKSSGFVPSAFITISRYSP